MKTNYNRKAPKVSKYNMDKNFMRESDKEKTGKISRITKKRLSK